MIEKQAVVQKLEALAHETRLDVYQMLMQAGPKGAAAGWLAEQLAVAPSALSFHLTRLKQAGLIHSRRVGQSILYAADFEQMQHLVGYLTESCCRQSETPCGPVCQ
ncbi:ArsR/SmtB family transcription factor [Saccharospirillum sp.]|uniref:ArsR/SmtB family transcription factor n=1 Tax=Saccharospirillum sp. TaxID=2033801 RepID=UPI0034A0281A